MVNPKIQFQIAYKLKQDKGDEFDWVVWSWDNVFAGIFKGLSN
jgi:spermidine/putrescine-binding protein